MSHFYLTLSSDSGCHFQESNKISKFKVHLGRVIELNGDWEVALFEIFYPETFNNVREGSCVIQKENIGELDNMATTLRVQTIIELQSKFYHTPDSLCKALNERTGDTLHFDVNTSNNKASIYANIIAMAKEKVSYKISDGLLDILGFSRGLLIENHKILEGEIPCDLRKGMPKSLKIYSDIISDQVINNSHDKLLREVHLNPDNFKFGFQQHKNFERLVFLPVVKKHLEFLEFYIKDERDQEFSFSHGTLKVILLFRRVGYGL